jgi:D-3-phosphoglycerate dehydrogenase / 2-oxoglutarate reductase
MTQTRILITDGMDQGGLDLLQSEEGFIIDVRSSTPVDELHQIIGNYDCIVIRSATTLTRDLIEKATSMKLIVRAGAGVDNIDVDAATGKKIPVMNTASANSLAAAEQTIALMFAMLRQIPQASQSLAEGRWDRKLFTGFEATGKILGVIGLGNIGRLVAEKALGLGMQVIAYDPFVKDASQLPGVLTDRAHGFSLSADLSPVFQKADILTLHIPKTTKTTHLINANLIQEMKDGSFLMNCARGGIVDEKAVLAALDSGKLRGAAFDVFEKEPPEFPNPLFTHKNAVCVPHLGASTVEAQARVGLTAANQIANFMKREDHTGVINGL